MDGGPGDRGARDGLGRYPWVVMGIVLVATYMVVLDTTVLGVALPRIAEDLDDAPGLSIDWVLITYLVAVAATQPATGWMADRFGRRNVYLAALGLFVLGSALSGFAPTRPVLVVARVVQGAGGGVMMPVGMAMVYELFPPHRRGTALGIQGIALMAAPALGPPAGGWLVTHATWRWIFLANLPIGAVALVLGLRLLRDIGYREARPLDWRGWTMGSVSMIGLVMVSRQAGEWGWGSAATIGTASGSFLVLAWLVVRSLRSADPIIDFRMFAAPGFSLTFVLMGLNTVTMFARVVFLPVELQVVRGMSALDVGLLLAPAALGVAVTMPIGGWLADRVGARAPVTIGVAFTLVATWMLAGLEPSTSETEIVVALLVAGVGTGFALTPLNVSALNALPARLVSQGTAVRAMGNQLASALGTAAFAALVVARLGAVAPYGMGPGDLADGQAAYNGVFAVSLVIMAGTLGLALFLPGRAATREHQAARVAEHEALVAAAGRE